MSGFFSDIYGKIRDPDVAMNHGPLPSQDASGWPSGFNGNPDGRIGDASSLLAGVKPYSYGGPDKLSTQAAYLNIPHVTQRLVPAITIPLPLGGGVFRLSHQVDDGDIAFVVRCMFSPYEMVEEKKKYARQGVIFAIDPLVNLATVNYLLHGIQRHGFKEDEHDWHSLWVALGVDLHFPHIKIKMRDLEEAQKKIQNLDDMTFNRFTMTSYKRMVVDYLVQNVIKPFGVPRGSEKQGGQHQGLINKSVTWPVDLVTSVVVDGRVINMVNFWKNETIHAGDDLLLYVEETECRQYVLSHHHSNVCNYSFQTLPKESMHMMDKYNETYKQQAKRCMHHLVQGTDFKIDDDFHHLLLESSDLCFRGGEYTQKIFQLVTGVSSSNNKSVQQAVWKDGYWHIARSQVMQYKHEEHQHIYSRATSVLGGNLLQVTFEPTWMDALQSGTQSRKKMKMYMESTDSFTGSLLYIQTGRTDYMIPGYMEKFSHRITDKLRKFHVMEKEQGNTLQIINNLIRCVFYNRIDLQAVQYLIDECSKNSNPAMDIWNFCTQLYKAVQNFDKKKTLRLDDDYFTRRDDRIQKYITMCLGFSEEERDEETISFKDFSFMVTASICAMKRTYMFSWNEVLSSIGLSGQPIPEYRGLEHLSNIYDMSPRKRAAPESTSHTYDASWIDEMDLGLTAPGEIVAEVTTQSKKTTVPGVTELDLGVTTPGDIVAEVTMQSKKTTEPGVTELDLGVTTPGDIVPEVTMQSKKTFRKVNAKNI
jgi:hypothetical protein